MMNLKYNILFLFKIINLNKYYQNITCFVFISVTNKGLKLSGNVLH